jgi:nitroimidazol reductase NimA-like FMN-containing flavoprotein (pyridoxamine 5'-phosphate oxidase superfamily)
MNEIVTNAIGFIDKSHYALLITVGEANTPFAREVGPFANIGLDIYFVTRLDSEKVKQFTANPSVAFYFPNMSLTLKEFKSVTVSGTIKRVPAGMEFDDALGQIDTKSPGYVKYISKEGFEIWTVFKMTASALQYTDYSKSNRTVKIAL